MWQPHDVEAAAIGDWVPIAIVADDNDGDNLWPKYAVVTRTSNSGCAKAQYLKNALESATRPFNGITMKCGSQIPSSPRLLKPCCFVEHRLRFKPSEHHE